MLVESDQIKVLEDRVALLEKRLKTAESQCQATTREIWQMENELARTEERASTAEARALEAESKLGQAPAEDEAALERERQLRRELNLLQEELEQTRHNSIADKTEAGVLRSQLSDALRERAALQVRLETLDSELVDFRLQIQELKDTASANPGADPEMERELSAARAAEMEMAQRLDRSESDLALQREKNELLQDKVVRLQERLELSEEKAMLVKQKIEQQDERGQRTEILLQAAQQRERDLERELQAAKDRADRLETRGRDGEQIFEAAQQQMREAEAKNQESWHRVRDAETRANQAVVEAKKLADRLAEFEKRSQESDRETQRLAFQDPLTGLPNNNLINQYLDFTVKQAVRYRRVAALLIVDVDNFKVFNEAMGFKAGDELLVKISERLKQAIRETDSLGRRGEDEFLILLTEINVATEGVSPEMRARSIRQHVEVVANRLMESFTKPFALQGQKFYIQASVGISICPDDGETPTAIMENAETAMYFAKENGRNRFQFFSTQLRKQQEKRLSLDNQLRSGLERGEFILHYQPIIQLVAGKERPKGAMVGVEALVRWNHRIDGLCLPEHFLAAAEESGAIVPLGHWVIRQACHQLREWLTSGLRIFASVNLSKRQLLQADLVDTVTKELREQGVSPDYLYLEIAEGFNTFNPDLMDKVVNDLGHSGLRIAIDDFGIGYSSLSRLNLAHTKIIKIDRSIIQGCPHDKQASTVAVAAINLANSLGLYSLAEGVENAAQLKFLTKYNCSLAQGFYFSEPIVAADIAALHRAKKTWKV